ncbi:hypothetical protein ABMY45_05125 [Pseudoalteromonas sp. XMcav11-Q]
MKSLFSLILSTGRKKSIKRVLSRSLCKKVGGSGIFKGDGPREQQAEKQNSDG